LSRFFYVFNVLFLFKRFFHLRFQPHGAQQQTSRTPLLLSIDGTDRQTDGLTLDRYVDPDPHILHGQRQYSYDSRANAIVADSLYVNRTDSHCAVL